MLKCAFTSETVARTLATAGSEIVKRIVMAWYFVIGLWAGRDADKLEDGEWDGEFKKDFSTGERSFSLQFVIVVLPRQDFSGTISRSGKVRWSRVLMACLKRIEL